MYSKRASQYMIFHLNNAHPLELGKSFTRMEKPTVWFTIRARIFERSFEKPTIKVGIEIGKYTNIFDNILLNAASET